jgi:hypothetical protein
MVDALEISLMMEKILEELVHVSLMICQDFLKKRLLNPSGPEALS